jgi:putative ABC transport system permease protein
VSPVEALRDSALEQPAAAHRLRGLLTFIGVAVLAPVVVAPMMSVLGAPVARVAGVPGRLARENARRNPRRTASTASALMIGVGL